MKQKIIIRFYRSFYWYYNFKELILIKLTLIPSRPRGLLYKNFIFS